MAWYEIYDCRLQKKFTVKDGNYLVQIYILWLPCHATHVYFIIESKTSKINKYSDHKITQA